LSGDDAGAGASTGSVPAPGVPPGATPDEAGTAAGAAPGDGGSADTSAAAAEPADTGTPAPPGISAGRLLALSVAAVVWTVVLLSVAAVETDGLSRVFAGLVVLVGVVVAVLGLFPPLRPPSIPRRTAVWAVVAVLCADGLVTAGWPLWSYHRANTVVTVPDWSLRGNLGLLPKQSATFQAKVTAHRKYVVITFEVTDTDRTIGTCAPLTTLDVVPASTTRPQQPVQVAPDTRAKIRLEPGQDEITLTVTVVNPRDDANCGVNLQISRVALSNG
jgi:hypothetical protein